MSTLPQAMTWVAVVAVAVIALRFLVSLVAKVVTLALAGAVATWLVLGGDVGVLQGWWERIISLLPHLDAWKTP